MSMPLGRQNDGVLLDLSWARSVGATKGHLVGKSYHGRAAGRTGSGKQKGRRIAFSRIPIHPNDLRNDFSRLSNPHIIPNAHIFARHLFLVVEARSLNHRPSEMNGLENCHGSEDSRAPHGDDDLPKAGSLFLRGILEGHRPTGSLGCPS
jgi:hypothetical protein